MGSDFPSVATAFCIVYETVVAMNKMISFMKHRECLGGKGNWINLRYWYCDYFFFLMLKGRDELL